MILKKFSAENFRNIKKCNIDFSKGVNLLSGMNAQGKTNAIEGIFLFSRGKSFRCQSDRDLVKFGEEGFHLSIEYQDKDGNNTLEYSSFGREKLRKKNGYKINRISEMIGNFKSVLFYPDNLGLVKNGPEERRNFLNVAISQCYNSYISNYSRFKEALDNRNALLKAASKNMYVDRDELISWSVYLAEYSSYIYIQRMIYIKKLSEHMKKIGLELSSGKEEISLIYKSDLEKSYDSEKSNTLLNSRSFSDCGNSFVTSGSCSCFDSSSESKNSVSSDDLTDFCDTDNKKSLTDSCGTDNKKSLTDFCDTDNKKSFIDSESAENSVNFKKSSKEYEENTFLKDFSFDFDSKTVNFVKSQYEKIYTSSLERECFAGSSLFGPHRDDFIVNLNGVSARNFASQGQQRSIVLAMKLSEGEVIKDLFSEYPVFLFDDVLSELDSDRKKYVIEGMKDRQIIITSCEKDGLEERAEKIIDVSGGEYVSSHR